MYLFFDTETTGKPDIEAPANARHQPRMIQLGAILTDRDGNELDELNEYVKPDGWKVPAEASAVNNITTEMCEARGIPIFEVLAKFDALANKAYVLLAHNIDFDGKMLNIEYCRAQMSFRWDRYATVCTMKTTADVVKIPGRYGEYKWPSLNELHRFVFRKNVENAHDAMADVRAMVGCFFELRKRDLAFTDI